MSEQQEKQSGIEEQLKSQGVYVSTTVGWSMWPMLRNRRDRIVVLPVGEEGLKRYDLPLYRLGCGRARADPFAGVGRARADPCR